MADEDDAIVQEFTLWKLGGHRVVLKIDSEQGIVKYIRKGQVKHSCMIKDLTVTNKNGLQLAVNIEHHEKILSAENSQVKEDILKSIKDVIDRHTPKPDIPLIESARIIKEGYLIKKGNAVIEKWARRKVCIKQGFMIYYPDQSEKIVKLSPVIECHVEAIGTDKFNLKVPERTYSFQIPDSVREKQEERDDWIRCIRIAIMDRKKERAGSQKVLPDAIIRHSANRKSFPKSLILKQGFLDKQGNAAVKVWKERFVKVEPGKFSYALPDKVENTLNVVNLSEGEVSIISTKNYGLDVQVPGRIFHFRVHATEENKAEEHWNWMEAFNKACCLGTSAELLEDKNKEKYLNDTRPTDQCPENTMDNAVNENSCRLTILVPQGETLNVIRKPSRSDTKKPTREHLRREVKGEPP